MEREASRTLPVATEQVRNRNYQLFHHAPLSITELDVISGGSRVAPPYSGSCLLLCARAMLMLCHAEHASMNHLEQVSKLFLLMLMQFLSYCFNQAWPIRDETIINLARQMLQVLGE